MFDEEQVALSEKALACGVLVKPSNGLEPLTPSLPWSNEEGSAGKGGKPRARNPRKKKESPEDK